MFSLSGPPVAFSPRGCAQIDAAQRGSRAAYLMFVSHTGDICPAGFLPLVAGNVRNGRVADVYRHSPVFEPLHDSSLFQGKCGRCEYRALCGGSRARAFAATGNPLAEDSFCPYQPGSGTH